MLFLFKIMPKRKPFYSSPVNPRNWSYPFRETRSIINPSSYSYDLNHGHHARNNMVPIMRSGSLYHPQNRNPSVPAATYHGTPRVDHHGAYQSYVAGSVSARLR